VACRRGLFAESGVGGRSYARAVVEGPEDRPGTPQFLDADPVIATAEHIVGDDAPRGGGNRGDAEISEAVLREVHADGVRVSAGAG
jgi:beta-glucosidase